MFEWMDPLVVKVQDCHRMTVSFTIRYYLFLIIIQSGPANHYFLLALSLFFFAFENETSYWLIQN